LGIIEMRRHYTNYFKGIPHFKDYRMKLVTLNSYDEILAVLDDIREQFSNLPLINS
jgi:tRNA-dihydrouridine synthase